MFSHLHTEGDTSDRVRMITTAFAAFYAVGNSIASSQREDVRGVAVLLYSGQYMPFSSTSFALTLY